MPSKTRSEARYRALCFSLGGLQEAAAQHGRQAERDEAGDQDRDHDHHREFVKQPADDAAHEKHRE